MFLNEPKIFEVSVKGSITGHLYEGVFKVKPLLSHRDQLKMDEFKRQLMGESPAGASTSATMTSAVFARIWTHLLDAPGWWKDKGNGLELLDEEPVVAVLESIDKIQNEISDSIVKNGESAKKDLTELAKKA